MSDVRTPPPWHPKQSGSPPGRVRVTRLCGYLNLHQIPISSCNNVDLTGRDRGSEPLRSFPSEPRSRVKCVHRPLLERHFLGCGRRTSFPNASVFPSVTRDFWASGGAIRLDQLLIPPAILQNSHELFSRFPDIWGLWRVYIPGNSGLGDASMGPPPFQRSHSMEPNLCHLENVAHRSRQISPCLFAKIFRVDIGSRDTVPICPRV